MTAAADVLAPLLPLFEENGEHWSFRIHPDPQAFFRARTGFSHLTVSKPDHELAEIIVDERSLGALWVGTGLPGYEPASLAAVAYDQIQDFVAEDSVLWGQERPRCPGHPHGLRAVATCRTLTLSCPRGTGDGSGHSLKY